MNEWWLPTPQLAYGEDLVGLLADGVVESALADASNLMMIGCSFVAPAQTKTEAKTISKTDITTDADQTKVWLSISFVQAAFKYSVNRRWIVLSFHCYLTNAYRLHFSSSYVECPVKLKLRPFAGRVWSDLHLRQSIKID